MHAACMKVAHDRTSVSVAQQPRANGSSPPLLFLTSSGSCSPCRLGHSLEEFSSNKPHEQRDHQRHAATHK